MPTNTPEQDQIISAARDTTSSLMVQAYAGCGKTSTLVLIAQALPAVPSLALAFNVKIKKELEARFPKHFEVKTMNGLGHSAWGRACGKRLVLDDKKIGKLVSEVFKEHRPKATSDEWDYVRSLVGTAMNAGLVPSGFAGKALLPDSPASWRELAEDKHGYYDEDLCWLTREVLGRSIKQSIQGLICFDDQLYMSALFGGVFPKFGIVLVDEAQDLSPLNHIQLTKTSPPAGRLIVVGDKHQAIYGFRGAHTSSMEKIRELKPQWTDLTLTLTFRCPKLIVQRQHNHVPAFQPFHTNPEGKFFHLRRPEDTPPDEPYWHWSDLQVLRQEHTLQSVAIICRNNAPLFSTAFKLIRQGVGVTMLGRDIGKSLSTLAKKIIPTEADAAGSALAINKWIDQETSLARANGNDDKADSVYDRGYCLLAVLETAPGADGRAGLLAALDRLFSNQSELVQLGTIHRVKGLEFDLVVFLDPWRVPSKRSLDNPKELAQEMNLKYVAETRTKKVLVWADAEGLKRS